MWGRQLWIPPCLKGNGKNYNTNDLKDNFFCCKFLFLSILQ